MTARARASPLLAALLLQACGESGARLGPELQPPAPDLAALFAPARPDEIAAVRAEWAARDVAPVDVRVEASESFLLGSAPATLRVISHVIEGGRHYGAVVAPEGAADGSLPVVVYTHGGDSGVRTADLGLIALVLGGATADFVWVVPSFRAETLSTGEGSWRSGGEPSPWDRDVDDALALLGAALDLTPAADPARVGVLGFSRGAGVGLLMGIRDARIDRVVSFFGPTDFFGAYVQDVIEEAIDGELRDLPGLPALDRQFVQPFVSGTLAVEDVRPELVRRSAVLFAEDLPPVQIHHGTEDVVVDVSQADALIEALEALGRGAPEDGFHLYPGGGHDPLTLPGSVPRTLEFLGRLDVDSPTAPSTRGVTERDPPTGRGGTP